MEPLDRSGLQPRRASVDPDRALEGPIRTCIGCRGRDSRSALLRVVAGSAAGSDESRLGLMVPVIPDPGASLTGRGAWLHPTRECCDLAVRRRAFARALRVQAPVETAALTAYVIDLTQHRTNASEHDNARPTDRPKGTESGFDADEHPMSTQQ